MAKRKRRKTTKKAVLEVRKEVYAILFIVAAVIGLGKLGPVGRCVAAFSLFLTGSFYMVSLVILLILGVYIFIKSDWPDFFSTKFLGFYLFIIGLLSFMHWDYVILNNGNASVIFRETFNELSKAFSTLASTGVISENVAVGGGLIGGVFALLFSKLFSDLGMKIVSITFMVAGVCLFTGFSISEFINNRLSDVKDRREKRKEKNKDDDDEDNPIENKKVKISNGNEIEEVEKTTIKNINEIKKINTVEGQTNTEENKNETEEVHQNHINPAYQLPSLDI